ncbi:MAG: ThiF family adenylyltransferase [Kiritimatiellae bacterium]|nr:ThiF family adenylyltransferase [Kiritimatiellia bacterium]
MMQKRYSRQLLFPPIGEDGQKRLMKGRALLVGCGGLGTIIADILVRAGIGFLRIVDRDFVEESNLQRQVLFDTQDVADNIPKAEAARLKLNKINPNVEVSSIVRDMDSSSILDLMSDVDIVLDGTDNFEARYLINDAAIHLNKPWVYGAVVGSLGMSTTIVPGKTPCLRCLYEDPPPPGSTPTCDTAGIISPIVHMIASVQSSEAMKILSGGSDEIVARMLYMDVWKGEYRSLKIQGQRDPGCDVCGKKNFTYLNAERGSFVTSMCGRNAVQISWKEKHEIDFQELAERLANSGNVTFNKFLLKFSKEDLDITLFHDGRAIIEGISDPDKARDIYSKFIG